MDKQTFDPNFFKVSWIVDLLEMEESKTAFVLSNYQPTEKEKKYRAFGVCAAPGKRMAKGRDGKTHSRNIEVDVKFFRECLKVDVIICLLDRYELRTIGVDLDVYKKACVKNGITLINYPIVEMGVPFHDPSEFDKQLIRPLLENLCNRKRVICHCRGGIGRAGTVASCAVLRLGLASNSKMAISTIRKLRDPRAVESKKQEDYIKAYADVKGCLDIA